MESKNIIFILTGLIIVLVVAFIICTCKSFHKKSWGKKEDCEKAYLSSNKSEMKSSDYRCLGKRKHYEKSKKISEKKIK